mgnify:CR=1 FL=1
MDSATTQGQREMLTFPFVLVSLSMFQTFLAPSSHHIREFSTDVNHNNRSEQRNHKSFSFNSVICEQIFLKNFNAEKDPKFANSDKF